LGVNLYKNIMPEVIWQTVRCISPKSLCSAELLDHPTPYRATAPTWPDTNLKIVLEHTTKPHVLGLMIKLRVCQQAVQGTIHVWDGLQKKSAKEDSSRRL